MKAKIRPPPGWPLVEAAVLPTGVHRPRPGAGGRRAAGGGGEAGGPPEREADSGPEHSRHRSGAAGVPIDRGETDGRSLALVDLSSAGGASLMDEDRSGLDVSRRVRNAICFFLNTCATQYVVENV